MRKKEEKIETTFACLNCQVQWVEHTSNLRRIIKKNDEFIICPTAKSKKETTVQCPNCKTQNTIIPVIIDVDLEEKIETLEQDICELKYDISDLKNDIKWLKNPDMCPCCN